MRNILKLIGISTMIFVLVFTFTACSSSNSGSSAAAAVVTENGAGTGSSVQTTAAAGTTQTTSAASTTKATSAASSGTEKTFTAAELKKYDGQNGNPAYVAVDGVVYDVTNVRQWKNGRHQGYQAGVDLSEAIKSAPHGKDILKKVPVVGKYVAG